MGLPWAPRPVEARGRPSARAPVRYWGELLGIPTRKTSSPIGTPWRVGKNDLDAQLDFAQRVNKTTETANRRLAEEIKESTDEVNALAAKTQRHEATQRDLEAQREELSKKVKAAEDQHALAAQQLDELKQFRSRHPQGSSELDAQIAKLETTLQEV